jgi:hypothetical protein
VLVGDVYLAQSFNLALVPISKDDCILVILVLDVGGEHLLLPRHVVCASAVNNPACTTTIQAIPVGLVPTGFSPKPTGFSYSRRF